MRLDGFTRSFRKGDRYQGIDAKINAKFDDWPNIQRACEL